ncbi:MAG: tRNA (adenosine(37)-N6)-threonylcarbamoyltransferase complex dimerization subunit type 1 TsaB [Firmicutes bacterium]|nr:tRNA (adenosine(37)-N6)-threonylcarbamoyltransferase complex dimerization subunit type 1 TsaB [Bacillota bacterium]
MRVLGLDSSTSTGGVALLDGDRLVAEYTLDVRRTTHSERLMPAVKRVMDDAGLDPQSGVDGIAVATGPGSFTGLRIAVVTAKSLSYAWRTPLAGISTLEAMAFQAAGPFPLVCPLIDARYGNVYAAAYEPAGEELRPRLAPGLRPIDEVLDWLEQATAGPGTEGPVMFVGDGVPVHWDALASRLGDRARRPPAGFLQLRAAAVAALGARRLAAGRQDDPARLVPSYLRKSEAERKWEAGNRSRSSSSP